jgi:hypothetical protein
MKANEKEAREPRAAREFSAVRVSCPHGHRRRKPTKENEEANHNDEAA